MIQGTQTVALLQPRGVVYLWLIHADVWQKSTQYCRVIILQLKIKKLILKKEKILLGTTWILPKI